MTPKKGTAQHARLAYRRRLEVLARLEAGALDILELLANPPDALLSADLWDVLLKVPGLHRAGIETACTRAQVWPHRKLREMIPDEVRRISTALPDRVK